MRGLLVGLCAFVCVSATAAWDGMRLINGTEVPAGQYLEVGQITLGAARCTGTLVGPRVLITAASCGVTGGDIKVKLNGNEYTAKMTRSPLFDPSNSNEPPHDIGIALFPSDIPGVTPVNVMKAQTAVAGTALTLLGYGCTIAGGGPLDNKLRVGDTAVTTFTKYDMLSRKENGAALCFGDLGGPAYVTSGGKKFLLGVNSTGNMKDLNYSTRLDIADSVSFLTNYASTNNVTICGINQDCGGITPTPPTCTMQASPNTVKVGENVKITLLASANAKSATIDGSPVTVPSGDKIVQAMQKGLQTSNGTVSGDGGTGNCSASFMVEENPQPTLPTCTLAAIPSQIQLGNSLSLEIKTFNATSAKLDGIAVNLPNDKKTITPTAKGTFSARGDVSNGAGSNSCWASYTVTDGTPPETPNFAVVPAYCGDNVLSPASKVKRVCVGVVRHDSTIQELHLKEALILTYDDGSREVMPIIARTRNGATGADRVEDMWMYTNNPLDMGTYYVFETKVGQLTRSMTARNHLRGEVPIAVEGRSIQGWYFLASSLSPTGVSK